MYLRTAAAIGLCAVAMLVGWGCRSSFDSDASAGPSASAGPVGPVGPVGPSALSGPQTPTTVPPRVQDPLPTHTPLAPATSAPPGPTLVQTGEFDVNLAPQASGIAVGRRDPNVLWIVNDEAGTTSILAVDATGAELGQITMQGVDATNLEDVATGPCAVDDASPCVFVADIGDNVGGRTDIVIHRFPEPAPGLTAVEVTSARLTYPDGPVDAEALVVDQAGVPVILTKEPGLARLFAPAVFADGPMALLATVTIPPPDAPLLTSLAGLNVTAADLSPDGQRLLLRTYDSIVELTAAPGATAISDVALWSAAELPAPFEPQGEAVAYRPDGRSVVTVSEGSGAIWTLQR